MTEQNQTPKVAADDTEGHHFRSDDDAGDDTAGHHFRSDDDASDDIAGHHFRSDDDASDDAGDADDTEGHFRRI